ncbi:DUF1385 domain-containing protein [Candidatus Aerophobetes bacterium]|nr:DUF1385 domain-containing protein [Candidatus Aerophobetes bacterium]
MDKKRSHSDTDSSTESPIKGWQVGGQAVIEGVMMRSPESVTVAIRKNDGQIVVKKEPYIALSKRYKLLNLPIIRGAVVLIESLYLGIKALSFSAEEAMEEESPPKKESGKAKIAASTGETVKKEKIFTTLWLILSLLMGFALALLIFFYLPLILTGLTGVKGGFLFNLIDGFIRITFFLIYVWAISLWKSMRRIFEYHGAEHKSIFTFEAGKDLTVENAKKYSTRHPGCGTSFLLIVMLVSILVFMFLGRPHTISDRLTRLLFVPLIAGISYELTKLSRKKRKNRIVKMLIVPGLWLQKITTKEPDEAQLKVALAALKSALK